MRIVQQMRIGTNRLAHGLKQARRVTQIFFGAPIVLARQRAIGRFVHAAIATDTIDFIQPWNTALRTNGQVAHFFVTQDFVNCFGRIAPSGMCIRHDAGAAAPSQQLVKRLPCNFGFDVPKGCVHSRNSRHGDRATAPICALVQVLPNVFDLLWVAAYQTRNNVLF